MDLAIIFQQYNSKPSQFGRSSLTLEFHEKTKREVRNAGQICFTVFETYTGGNEIIMSLVIE